MTISLEVLLIVDVGIPLEILPEVAFVIFSRSSSGNSSSASPETLAEIIPEVL